MKDRQLLLPADDRQVEPARVAVVLTRDAEQQVGGNQLRLAFERQRLDLLDDDGVSDQRVGRLADQDLHGGRVLLRAARRC